MCEDKDLKLPDLPDKDKALDFYQKLRVKIKNATKESTDDKNDSSSVYSKFTGVLFALPDLFHLGIKLSFDGSVPNASKGALVAGIVYTIMPVDVVPDVIPVIGWVDDLIVMTLAINKFLDTEDKKAKEAIEKHWAGDEDIFKLLKDIIDIINEAAEFLPAKLLKSIEGLRSAKKMK